MSEHIGSRFYESFDSRIKLKNKLLSYDKFQNYIINLSNSFINITFDKIDSVISDSLKHFCSLYDFDHSSIWVFDDDEKCIPCKYHWSNNPTIPAEDGLYTIHYSQAEKFFNFKNFNSPVFFKFSDFEPQDIPFSSIAKKAGMKALYIFPMMNNGSNIGGLVLGTGKTYDEMDENIAVAGQLYCALITTVLLHKMQESAYKESSENNRLILDSINEGVGLYDRNGNILFFNKHTLDSYGDQIQVGKKIYDQIIPGLEDLCRDRINKFEQVIETGKQLIFEDGINDGWYSNRLYPILRDGKVKAVTVITEDITHVKKADALRLEAKVLKEKEHDYLEIIDGSTIASWIYDYDRGVLKLSKEWAKRIGCEDLPDEKVAYYFDTIIDPEDLDRLSAERKEIFKNKQERFKHEYRVKTLTGGYIWILDQGKIIYNENGTPSKVYGTTMDLDDVKKAEEDLKRIQKELQESQQQSLKLIDELRKADKNKNEFLSILSHELRNPLATIAAGLTLLNIKNVIRDNDSTVSIIDRQVKQLCKLVDDLLDLTRISNNKVKLKKEYTNLNTLILSTFHDLESFFIDKNIDFQIDQQDNLSLMIDPARIKQILENLLHNAINYTDSGGKVVLTVSKRKREALISVKDNGIGIDPEIVPIIFEPFKQADNSLERTRGGLGLGLAIVSNITRLHEGRVEAFSEGLGKGSEFIIHLPLGHETNSKLIVHPETLKNSINLHILLIEDNQDFAVLLCSILKNQGFNIEYCDNSLDGLERVEKNNYDAVICDIGMPILSGYEIAKRIKGLPHPPKLIALTGYARNKEKQLAMKSGFDFHLAKPVDLTELDNILRESGS